MELGDDDPRGTWDELLARGQRVVEHEGVWTLLGHQVVRDAALDATTFSSASSRFLQVPNGMDGDEHRRYRAVIERYMTRERVAALEPTCRRLAGGLVDSIRDDTTVEVVEELGAPFAVRAQTAWLGWSAGLEPTLLAWMSDHRHATRTQAPDSLADVADRFDAIVRGELDARRRNGLGADVTSELMADTVGATPLRDEELVSILRNWTAGDLGSLAASCGVVVHALAADRELQREMRDLAARDDDGSRAALDRVIDELLRIDDPFLSNRRITTRSVEIDGHRIPAGSRVVLAWTAANRDPARFDDPARRCPQANAAHNLVYGIGRHVCPGRSLATMELRCVVAALLARSEQVSLAADRASTRSYGAVGGWESVRVNVRRR